MTSDDEIAASSPRDTFSRPLSNLRLSVTDRCNLRCSYCMPEEDYVWLPRKDLLTFEEIGRLVDVFRDLGVTRLRITGGEPLLRRGLSELIRQLAAKDRIEDLALTTNGVLLAEQARELRDAGLGRITISLDSLNAERFRKITRRDDLPRVLEGIEAAGSCGFESVKLDTVVMKGVNDGELDALIDYGRKTGAEVRFIEYMDVGGATRWSMDDVFSRAEMLAHFSGATPVNETTSAPADRYRLPDGTVFGIISSTTAPFCSSCDRSRLTADGMWLTCLYATSGTDLRAPLRDGATPDELRDRITGLWRARSDRGAEDRLANGRRDPLVQIEDLRANPHLEMHTRGG